MARIAIGKAINEKNGIFIILTNIFIEEDNGYVVKCPELGISSQGDTIEESEKKIKDAVCVFLNSIESIGLRDKIFKKEIPNKEIPKKESEAISINMSDEENTFYRKTLVAI